MSDILYWYNGKGKCPFDKTVMEHKKNFKSNDGRYTCPIFYCPLCERLFVVYKEHLDLMKRFPGIMCRFLELDSPVLDKRKRKEEVERLAKGIYEPSVEQLLKYKPLFQYYTIPSEKEFVDCFTEKESVFQHFSNRFKDKSQELPNFLMASEDKKIHPDIRLKISLYNQKIQDIKRTKEIQAFFFNNFKDEKGQPYILDDEQALAVAVENPYVIAMARAGSGKTRTLVAKIVYLMESTQVPEEQILTLAFNNSVPIEINERIKKLIQSHYPALNKNYSIAKTFHKLAHDIVKPDGILTGTERTRFIQTIISELKENKPNFKERVYHAFRKESFQVNRALYSSEEKYYEILRGAQYETLNGETVKSVGEKWIADYLFERGIRYRYEPEFFPKYRLICTYSG